MALQWVKRQVTKVRGVDPMKSLSQSFAATVIAFVSTCGIASAAPNLNVPEPGSMALVGLAVAGVVAVARKGKK